MYHIGSEALSEENKMCVTLCELHNWLFCTCTLLFAHWHCVLLLWWHAITAYYRLWKSCCCVHFACSVTPCLMLTFNDCLHCKHYVVVDHFHIALFSALKHSLGLPVILHEWLAFYSTFIFIFISTEVVFWQHWHGWCHMKLLPSQHVLCSPYNSAPCHFMQSHIYVRCMPVEL